MTGALVDRERILAAESIVCGAVPLWIVDTPRRMAELGDAGYVATCIEGGTAAWSSTEAHALAGLDVNLLLVDPVMAEQIAADCSHATAVVKVLPAIHASPAHSLDVRALNRIAEDAPVWRRPACRVASGAQMRVVRLSDVRMRAVRWLWHGYLPLGKLVVLDGMPGQGKSTVTADIAARLSRGRAMPFAHGAAVSGDTLILSYEDDAEDTIKPRIIAAGGDARRVHIVQGVRYDGAVHDVPPSLPRDLDALETLLTNSPDVRLVIIDPLMAALDGSKIDGNKDQDMRGVLSRVAKLAETASVCVLVVRHLRKAAGTNAITAGGGSIGIIGQARVGLTLDKHPTEPDAAVLAVSKCNIAKLAPTLAFRKVDTTVPGDDEPVSTSRLDWLGEVSMTADELLQSRDDDPTDASKDAPVWLREMLANGPMPRVDLLRAAKAYGIADRTLDRAAKREGIVKESTGFGREKVALWRLPHVTIPATFPIPANSRHTENVAEMGKSGGNGSAPGTNGTPPFSSLVAPGSDDELALLAKLDAERVAS